MHNRFEISPSNKKLLLLQHFRLGKNIKFANPANLFCNYFCQENSFELTQGGPTMPVVYIPGYFLPIY